jgi:hypothetical protein
VEDFLATCPDTIPDLQEVFSRVLGLISQGADDEVFEDLENEVEALFVGMTSEAEREQLRNEVMVEFGDKNAKEQERIQDLKLIKHVREKYAIPHISLYYY